MLPHGLTVGAVIWSLVLASVIATAIIRFSRILLRIDSRDPSFIGLRLERERSAKDTDTPMNIVAVHGLGSNPATTWSARSGGRHRTHWLRDSGFLPDRFPDASIFTFNHHADYLVQAPITTASRSGSRLLQKLVELRKKDTAPLILIGHSYGGIVLKEALDLAHGNPNKYGELRKSVIGLVFLGTPHHGSAISRLGSWITWLLGPLLGSDGLLVRSMMIDSQDLSDSHDRFRENCRSYGAPSDLWENSTCFYENKPTMLVRRRFIDLGLTVTRNSASGGHPHPLELNTDHSGMNKFTRSDDPDYRLIGDEIERLRDSGIAERYRASREASDIEDNVRHKMPKDLCEQSVFGPSRPAQEATSAFLDNALYRSWTAHRLGDSLANESASCAFLRLRLTGDAKQASLINCAVNELRVRKARHNAETSDIICFCSGSNPDGVSARRASSLLETVLAQIVLQDRERLADLDGKTRKHLRHVLSSDPFNLSQDQYWNLLSALMECRPGRMVVLTIDRLDAIHEDDRRSFLAQLNNTMTSGSANIQLLVAHWPSEIIDKALGDMPTFDPNKSIEDAYDELRDVAKNPHQNEVGQDTLRHTGIWFEPYVDSLKSESLNLLWLNGPAGSGKTTLMRTTLDRLQRLNHAPKLSQMLLGFPNRLHFTAASRDVSSNGRKTIVTSYFYRFRQTIISEMSHTFMLVSLLFQIFWQEPLLLSSWLKESKSDTDVQRWDVGTIETIFRRITEWDVSFLTIYILVDAVDESMQDSSTDASQTSRSAVLTLLQTLWSSNGSHVTWKVIAASRDLEHTPPDIRSDQLVRLNEHNQADIETIIEAKLSEIYASLERSKFDVSQYKDDLTAFAVELRRNNKGLILWVTCVTDLIKARINKGTIKLEDLNSFLQHPPPDLDKLWLAIVAQLETRAQEQPSSFHGERLTRQAEQRRQQLYDSTIAEINDWLRWGALASSGLSIQEFKDAVAISVLAKSGPILTDTLRKQRILDNEPHAFRTSLAWMGGGFLDLKAATTAYHDPLEAKVSELKSPQYKVQLVHESAKIFLATAAASPFQIDNRSGNMALARLCVTYLEALVSFRPGQACSIPRTDNIVAHLENLPLLLYVFESLPLHLGTLDDEADATRILGALETCFYETSVCDAMIASLMYVWAKKQIIVSNHPRAWQNLVDGIATKSSPTVKDANRVVGDLLRTAAMRDSPNALFSIFATGFMRLSEPGSQHPQLWKEVFRYSQRSIREDRRFPEIVARHCGAKEVLDIADAGALHEAIRLGWSPETIISLVSDDRVLNVRDQAGLTLLHVASAQGLTRIAQMLIDKGADVNAQDSFRRTPLIHAVLSRKEYVAELLLQSGADPGKEELIDVSAMSIASRQSDHGMMQLLIRFGAVEEPRPALNAPNLTGWTTVPIEQTDNYIDRHELIEAIKLSFEEKRIVALTGLGGTGKTQLAVKYANELRKADPRLSVFWIDGSSLAHIRNSCEYSCHLVKPNGYSRREPPPDIIGFFLKWLGNTQETKWLLVLDNIEDEGLFELLSSHLPAGPMLLTARNPGVRGRTHGATIKVGAFSEADSSKLLQHRLGGHANEPLAAELARQLGYLPLAIVQASAFITRSNLRIEEYLELMNEIPGAASQLLDEEFEDRRGPSDLPNALNKTWAITFDQIRYSDESSIALLGVLSVLYGEDCPRQLLRDLFQGTDYEFVSALGTLAGYAFIEITSTHTVRMHYLIQLATRTWLARQSNSQLQHYEALALETVEKCFPKRPSFNDRAWCKELLPQALAVLNHDARSFRSRIQRISLLMGVARFHLDNNQLYDAETALGESEASAKQLLIDDQDTTWLSIKSIMIRLYIAQGRLTDARTLANKVLNSKPEASTQSNLELIACTVQLALIERSMWHLADAERLYRSALAMMETEHPDDQKGMLDAKAGLAVTMILQGRLTDALEYQREIAEAREIALGTNHPETLSAYDSLASTYGMLGLLDQAENMHRRVLDTRQKVLGPGHLSVWKSSANLAQTYRAVGRWDEAATLDRNALQSIRSALGEEHPLTLTIMANLAVTLREKGIVIHIKAQDVIIHDDAAMHEAKQLATVVREIRERSLGPQHPDTLTSQEVLASIMWHVGEEHAAELMMRQVVDRRKDIQGVNHPDALTSMAALASIIALQSRNRLSEAAEIEEEVVRIRRTVLGIAHPNTLSAEDNLAATRLQALEPSPLVLRVVLHGKQIAHDFGSCMRAFELFDYSDIHNAELTDAVLRMTFVRLRLSRWAEMVSFETESSQAASERTNNEVQAGAEQNDTVGKLLANLKALLARGTGRPRSNRLLASPYAAKHEHEANAYLPLIRDLNRRSERRIPLRLETRNTLYLAQIFQDSGALRTFVKDIIQCTNNLLRVLVTLRQEENRLAQGDAACVAEWSLMREKKGGHQEVVIVREIVDTVDPAILLGLGGGRHVFGGTRHQYANVIVSGNSRQHNGDVYGRVVFDD